MPRRKIPEQAVSNTGAVPAGDIREALPAVCRRIRLLRERLGMEQKALAGAIGVSASAVSNWENGRGRPDLNLLPALCRALGTTMDQLFGLEGPSGEVSPEELRFLERCRALNAGHLNAVKDLTEALLRAQQAEAAPQEAEELPPVCRLSYYDRPLAAGIGDPTEFEETGTPIWLYASPEVERADCVFAVNGDSMEPAFKSGDKVLVSRIPDAPALLCGEIGAFIAGNETYIKVYEKDGLHSLNPAYPTLTFDDTPVYLIGRVMGRLDADQIVPEEEAERRLATVR